MISGQTRSDQLNYSISTHTIAGYHVSYVMMSKINVLKDESH